jgi:hypothetical protein
MGMRMAFEVSRYLSISGQEERWSCMVFFRQKNHCHPRPSDAQASRGEGDPGSNTSAVSQDNTIVKSF